MRPTLRRWSGIFTPGRDMPASTVALVGCGRWGRHILRDLLGLGCAVTVVDTSPERRREALERGAASAAGRLSGLPDLAGIVVATPAGTHARVVEEALGRGVPVFCE